MNASQRLLRIHFQIKLAYFCNWTHHGGNHIYQKELQGKSQFASIKLSPIKYMIYLAELNSFLNSYYDETAIHMLQQLLSNS